MEEQSIRRIISREEFLSILVPPKIDKEFSWDVFRFLLETYINEKPGDNFLCLDQSKFLVFSKRSENDLIQNSDEHNLFSETRRVPFGKMKGGLNKFEAVCLHFASTGISIDRSVITDEGIKYSFGMKSFLKVVFRGEDQMEKIEVQFNSHFDFDEMAKKYLSL